MPRPAEKCLVCGDVASGFNFDCRSCECCKAFFRRNALRYDIETLECTMGGKNSAVCEITVKTRKRCKKCRLFRCYSAGMKKEWILSKEDKLQYRNKRLRMRLQMELNSSKTTAATPESQSTTSSPSPRSSTSTSEISLLSTSSPSSPLTSFSFLTFCLQNEHYLDINLSSPHNALPSQISPFPPDGLVIAEQHLLAELLSACGDNLVNRYRQVRHYLTDYMPIGSRPVSPHIFSRLLRMVGSLRAFSSLPTSGQQALIRANAVDLFGLRTVLLYDQDRECWCLADDAAQVTVLASLSMLKPFCSNDVFQRQKNLAGRYRKEWKEDRAIFDILTAVVLFSSPPPPPPPPQQSPQNCQSVVDSCEAQKWSPVVANEQRRYCRLLSRYLLVKYLGNYQVAEEAYHHLLGNIDEMRQLTGAIWRMMLNYRDAFRRYPALFSFLTVQQQQ